MRKIYQKKKTSQLFSLFNKTPRRTTRQKHGNVGQALPDVKKVFPLSGKT